MTQLKAPCSWGGGGVHVRWGGGLRDVMSLERGEGSRDVIRARV